MGNANLKEQDEFAIQDFTEFFNADEDQIDLFKAAIGASRKKNSEFRHTHVDISGHEFSDDFCVSYIETKPAHTRRFHGLVEKFEEEPGSVKVRWRSQGLTYIYGLGTFEMNGELRILLLYLGIDVTIGDDFYIVKSREPGYTGNGALSTMSSEPPLFHLRKIILDEDGRPDGLYSLTVDYAKDDQWVRRTIKAFQSSLPGISYEDYLLFREELLVEEALRETENFSLPAIGLNSVKDRTHYLRESRSR